MSRYTVNVSGEAKTCEWCGIIYTPKRVYVGVPCFCSKKCRGRSKSKERAEQRLAGPFDVSSRAECDALAAIGMARCYDCLRLGLFYCFPADKSAKRGFRGVCKECSSARCSRWHSKNSERVSARNAKWRRENPKLAKDRDRRSREKHRDKNNQRDRERYWANQEAENMRSREWYEKNKERVAERAKKYRDNNKDHVRSLWREDYRRRRRHPNFRIHQRMMRQLKYRLKSKSGKRARFDDLGYSAEDLVKHLERQFLRGMSWENMGEWHIDHIVPLASFGPMSANCPDFRRAWGLANLRPIWAKDNFSKGAKRTHLL